MVFWADAKTSSRKFIDLIFKSSSKWPVWDPPTDRLQIGDFGTVDPESGRFEWKGNIYKHPDLGDLVKGHEPPPQNPNGDSAEDVISITSMNARKTDVDFGVNADAQLAKAKFKTKWVFGSKAGAVLAAYRPVMTALPHDMDISLLTSHEVLQGMSIVTKVTTCPAYALYLASKDDRGISLALCVEAPIGSAPVSVGPEVSTSWVSEYGGGFYRAGNKTKEDCYTVLFDLKKCKVKEDKWWYRDSPAPDATGLDKLEDERPPWDLLNDEGIEEPPTIFQTFTDDEDE